MRESLSNKAKWAIVLASTLLLPAVLYFLYPVFGTSVNAISLAPPVVATLMFGWRVGVVFVFVSSFFAALVFGSLGNYSHAEGILKTTINLAVSSGVCFGADRLRHHLAQRRAMMAELFQAKKMEAIGRLAGGVAHDINNTLNAIMGSAFALRKELEVYGREFKDLDNITDACDRAAQLTVNLLGFARKSRFKKQTFSLNDVVLGVSALLERTTSKKIAIETAFDEDLPLVEADRGQVETAVMNLCLNALDAMKDGGRLTMSTGCRESTVSISVSDTGTGMDAAVRDQVFEPFFTTKPPGKGTGLGLPMVHGVVCSAGGDIALESAPGKGTTVTLTFPRAASEIADSRTSGIPTDPTEGPEFLRGRKVLLVDDEPLVLRAGIRMLNALGCEVVSAAGGREGVETFKRHRNGISLVVLDLLMPDLDGASALEQILETDEKIPVLLVSGFTHEVEKLDALQENRTNVGFLAKPYRSEGFVTAARQLLETSS